jgi:hypothetical protein
VHFGQQQQQQQQEEEEEAVNAFSRASVSSTLQAVAKQGWALKKAPSGVKYLFSRNHERCSRCPLLGHTLHLECDSFDRWLVLYNSGDVE